EERLDIKSIYISKEHYEVRKNNYQEKIEAAIRYAESTQICRSRLLLEYFGDTSANNCEQCDICLKNRKNSVSVKSFGEIKEEILGLLDVKPMKLVNLVDELHYEENYILHVLQWLLDNNSIYKNSQGEYEKKKTK
ncbi:MAG TPA: RecQ family zinc-binding domain-containing protein, partial [Salinivirgaceae bacterium]|nr:RecQ family zinc-binding domain-containing protein [Salinivirgaceae bacterium]